MSHSDYGLLSYKFKNRRKIKMAKIFTINGSEYEIAKIQCIDDFKEYLNEGSAELATLMTEYDYIRFWTDEYINEEKGFVFDVDAYRRYRIRLLCREDKQVLAEEAFKIYYPNETFEPYCLPDSLEKCFLSYYEENAVRYEPIDDYDSNPKLPEEIEIDEDGILTINLDNKEESLYYLRWAAKVFLNLDVKSTFYAAFLGISYYGKIVKQYCMARYHLFEKEIKRLEEKFGVTIKGVYFPESGAFADMEYLRERFSTTDGANFRGIQFMSFYDWIGDLETFIYECRGSLGCEENGYVCDLADKEGYEVALVNKCINEENEGFVERAINSYEITTGKKIFLVVNGGKLHCRTCIEYPKWAENTEV